MKVIKCKKNYILNSNKIFIIQVPVVVETEIMVEIETTVETEIMVEIGTVEIAKSTAKKVHAQLAMEEEP